MYTHSQFYLIVYKCWTGSIFISGFCASNCTIGYLFYFGFRGCVEMKEGWVVGIENNWRSAFAERHDFTNSVLCYCHSVEPFVMVDSYTCPVCLLVLPPEIEVEVFRKHIDSHYSFNSCPFCGELFRDDQLEPHVQAHLVD